MKPEFRPLFAALLACSVGSASGALIIVPAVSSTANENAFDGQTASFLVDNSGLSPAVNNGDSLAAAQAAVHIYGGYQQSYVSESSTADYFATGVGLAAQPTFVFDLGGDTALNDILLWQYQNDSGAAFNVGNHTRSVGLKFNTAAQGGTVFLGGGITLTMLPVTDGNGLGNGDDLNGVNAAQTFALTDTARYVQLTITDNYLGFQGITGGGDRAGLGEVRFFGQAVPEPATSGLLLAAGAALAVRRRKGLTRS